MSSYPEYIVCRPERLVPAPGGDTMQAPGNRTPGRLCQGTHARASIKRQEGALDGLCHVRRLDLDGRADALGLGAGHGTRSGHGARGKSCGPGIRYCPRRQSLRRSRRAIRSIERRTPYYAGFGGQWRPLARALTAIHAVTRPDVIGHFLALHVGEMCTELRREESERILRAQPFLSEVRVTAYDDGQGGDRVAVVTTDEISSFGGLAVRSQAPHVAEARLGEGNLSGEGVSVVGDWAAGLGLRDRYAGRVTDYSMFGRPYEVSLQGTRDVLGGYWTATFVHPFFTDLQRIGWIAQAGERRTYVSFSTLPQCCRRSSISGGGSPRSEGIAASRVGRGTSRCLVCRSPTSARHRVHSRSWSRPVRMRGRIRIRGWSRTTPCSMRRASTCWLVVRTVRFLRVRGFDALSGEQDIKLGTESVGCWAAASVLGGRPGRLAGLGMYAGLGHAPICGAAGGE